MKKINISNKTKKDLKYFIIMTLIITIVFELLKHFNQFNFISFLCGEFCINAINTTRRKIYQGSDKE